MRVSLAMLVLLLSNAIFERRQGLGSLSDSILCLGVADLKTL